MDIPENWKHKSGYHLNADGKSIEYVHKNRPLLAIVEGMVNETDNCMEYYTVIFNISGGKPWEIKVAHEIWPEKEKAKENLRKHMEYY